MTDADKDKELADNTNAAAEAAAAREEAMVNMYKTASAQGFSDAQIADQMSSKYTITVDDAKAFIAKHSEKPEAEQKPAEDKPAD